jgi:lipoyl synthase
MERKPDWLKAEYNKKVIDEMNDMISALNLNTVCNEAACPNRGECYRKHTATFLILGTGCTRHCRFCNVTQDYPKPVDPNEPNNIAEAVKRLGLRHVVITSVTRDDLSDGGAAHFAMLTKAVKTLNEHTAIELLIPDLQGNEAALKTILAANPDILGHNLETIQRLYVQARPEADYQRSLDVLKNVKRFSSSVITKTGIMLGLGETKDEVIHLIDDAVNVDCDIMTIGQYLRPSKKHLSVVEYIQPDIFSEYAEIGRKMGIKYVYSAPLVRSSYNASDAYYAMKYGEK